MCSQLLVFIHSVRFFLVAMNAAEARAAAAAEGLALLRAENATGFKGVCRNTGRGQPYKANLTQGAADARRTVFTASTSLQV